jgi:3-hydroxyisobutyrate dehydrogenase-like beta-hydroxyacid dehydrogenase
MSAPENSSLPNSIGFIGLGAMGKPMVFNLARSLAPGAHIHVYDVLPAAMEDVLAVFPDTIVKCSSAKEVTEQTVRAINKILLIMSFIS